MTCVWGSILNPAIGVHWGRLMSALLLTSNINSTYEYNQRVRKKMIVIQIVE